MPVAEFDFESDVVRQRLVCDTKGALRRVTQLTNLSREVIMDFFQEVAGHYPLDRYVVRQLPMSEMKHWLEQVLLQVEHAALQSHTIEQ